MRTMPSVVPLPRMSPSGWTIDAENPPLMSPWTSWRHLPVAMSLKAQLLSVDVETMYSPVACTDTPDTSP